MNNSTNINRQGFEGTNGFFITQPKRYPVSIWVNRQIDNPSFKKKQTAPITKIETMDPRHFTGKPFAAKRKTKNDWLLKNAGKTSRVFNTICRVDKIRIKSGFTHHVYDRNEKVRRLLFTQEGKGPLRSKREFITRLKRSFTRPSSSYLTILTS